MLQVRALPHVCHVNLNLHWHHSGTRLDASLSGIAVSQSHWECADAARVGSVFETLEHRIVSGPHICICDIIWGWCLLFAKGRSSNFSVLIQCRSMASYAVAMGSRFYFRWVPSELNQADGGSMRWEQLRFEEEAINRAAGLFL
eukprot:5846628-Karenia_brevis.AAC.1